jgi:hypothetical protein
MSKAAKLRNGIVDEEEGTGGAAMRRAKTEGSTMSYEGGACLFSRSVLLLEAN